MAYSVFSQSGSIAPNSSVTIQPPAGTNWLIKSLRFAQTSQANATVSILADGNAIAIDGTTNGSNVYSAGVIKDFVLPSGHSITISVASGGYTTTYNVNGVTI